MKTVACLVTLFTCASLLPTNAQVRVLATSPDHPKTWVAGATKSFLALRWDHKLKMLVADVTYSTRLWADDVHPPEEEDYTLGFPGVQLNPQENTLTVNGVTVARLHHLIIGDDIVLEKGFELILDLHKGLIFGSIVASQDT
jgi:hypothetical protein